MCRISTLLAFVLLVSMATCGWGAGTSADDTLSDRIRSMEKDLGALKSEVTELEAELARKDTVPAWMRKIKLFGDFRYRYEEIDDKRASADRHRNRIRARFGLQATVNDEWDMGLRIASGSADPVSTNQTLDESFSSKPVRLDRAYFDFHPTWMDGLTVVGGKVKNPFYCVGKNQLIWDSDLNPEGGAIQYGRTLNEQTSVHVTAGGFWVNEHSGGVDPSLWGLQGYVKHALCESTRLLAGVTWYDYGNIQGQESLPTEYSTGDDFFGNTNVNVGGNDVFQSDYDLIEVFAELGTTVKAVPVAIHGTCVWNTVAPSDRNAGWLVGGKLNKAKKPGSWEVSYDYRDLEIDAVVGQFSDSDFIGGGAGGKGHRFGLAYKLADNVTAALTYFDNELARPGSDEDYQRLQVDVKLKF